MDYYDIIPYIPSEIVNIIFNYCDIITKYNLKFLNQYWNNKFYDIYLNSKIVGELLEENKIQLPFGLNKGYLGKIARYNLFNNNKIYFQNNNEHSRTFEKGKYINFIDCIEDKYSFPLTYYYNNKEFYPYYFTSKKIALDDTNTNKIYLHNEIKRYNELIEISDDVYYLNVLQYNTIDLYCYINLQHCYSHPYKTKYHGHTVSNIIVSKLKNNVVHYYFVKVKCPHPNFNASAKAEIIFNNPYTKSIIRNIDSLIIYPIKNILQ